MDVYCCIQFFDQKILFILLILSRAWLFQVDITCIDYWKYNFPVRQSVGWSVSQLVWRLFCHNFLKGRDVTLSFSYQSTCFYLFNIFLLCYITPTLTVIRFKLADYKSQKVGRHSNAGVVQVHLVTISQVHGLHLLHVWQASHTW